MAEFEMWLDEQGKYEEFKKCYEKENNVTWKKARRNYATLDVTDILADILNKDYSELIFLILVSQYKPSLPSSKPIR